MMAIAAGLLWTLIGVPRLRVFKSMGRISLLNSMARYAVCPFGVIASSPGVNSPTLSPREFGSLIVATIAFVATSIPTSKVLWPGL